MFFMGPPPPLFANFVLLKAQILQKSCRLQQDKKAKETLISTLEAQLQVRSKVTVTALVQPAFTSGKSYKGSTIVNYSSRVVIWDIYKSGTTIES